MVNTCTHFCRISHVKLEFFNFCSNFSRFSQMPLDHCISQKNVKIFLLAHCRSLTHIRPTESFIRAYEDNSLPLIVVSSSQSLRVAESLSEAQRSEARARACIFFPDFFEICYRNPTVFQFFNFSIFQFSIFQFLNFNFQKGYQSTKSTFSK